MFGIWGTAATPKQGSILKLAASAKSQGFPNPVGEFKQLQTPMVPGRVLKGPWLKAPACPRPMAPKPKMSAMCQLRLVPKAKSVAIAKPSASMNPAKETTAEEGAYTPG